MLAVADTGTGMDLETQAQIFEPFFTTKGRDKGTGLGLATVYGVVKQSNGYIAVESEKSHGALFQIYLPRVDLPVPIKTETVQPPLTVGGSETVLLVEDAEPLRMLAQLFLKENGYQVLTAADGAEAQQVAAQHQGQIHLLLTDIVMPGINGRVLAERLGPRHPGMKVLFMSGYTDSFIAGHGVLDEGMHLLHKPFTEEALMRRVRELLDADEEPKQADDRAGAEAAGTSRNQFPIETAGGGIKMEKLLIVDDEEAMRRLLRINLADRYEIIDTGNAAQGLALAMQCKPNAILLYLRMPDYSGFELCRTFKVMTSTQLIPIIIVSGEAGATTKSFCKELRASAYFEKPVDFEALRTTLATILHSAQHERRREVRVHLRVTLKLQGLDRDEKPFAQTTITENVSKSGFHCGCTARLKVDATIEVNLVGGDSNFAGDAVVVRSEGNDTPYPHYGFRFVHKEGDWILQQNFIAGLSETLQSY